MKTPNSRRKRKQSNAFEEKQTLGLSDAGDLGVEKMAKADSIATLVDITGDRKPMNLDIKHGKILKLFSKTLTQTCRQRN